MSSALPAAENQRRVDTGAQIEAGGTRRGVCRQRKFAADARIEDADLESAITRGSSETWAFMPTRSRGAGPWHVPHNARR